MNDGPIPLHVTLDEDADAAYLYLEPESANGRAITQLVLDSSRLHGMVNVDLDDEGRLLGIEVIGATRWLPHSLLQQLRRA